MKAEILIIDDTEEDIKNPEEKEHRESL